MKSKGSVTTAWPFFILLMIGLAIVAAHLTTL
jgi:hypothetical protein